MQTWLPCISLHGLLADRCVHSGQRSLPEGNKDGHLSLRMETLWEHQSSNRSGQKPQGTREEAVRALAVQSREAGELGAVTSQGVRQLLHNMVHPSIQGV